MDFNYDNYIHIAKNRHDIIHNFWITIYAFKSSRPKQKNEFNADFVKLLFTLMMPKILEITICNMKYLKSLDDVVWQSFPRGVTFRASLCFFSIFLWVKYCSDKLVTYDGI